MRLCFFKWSRRPKRLEQTAQEKGLNPVWILLCRVNSSLRVNVFPHDSSSHLNGLSPLERKRETVKHPVGQFVMKWIDFYLCDCERVLWVGRCCWRPLDSAGIGIASAAASCWMRMRLRWRRPTGNGGSVWIRPIGKVRRFHLGPYPKRPVGSDAKPPERIPARPRIAPSKALAVAVGCGDEAGRRLDWTSIQREEPARKATAWRDGRERRTSCERSTPDGWRSKRSAIRRRWDWTLRTRRMKTTLESSRVCRVLPSWRAWRPPCELRNPCPTDGRASHLRTEWGSFFLFFLLGTVKTL